MTLDPNAAGTTEGAGEGGIGVDQPTGTPPQPIADGTAGEDAAAQLAAAQAENERLRQAQDQLLGEKTKYEEAQRELEYTRRLIAGGGIVPPTAADPRQQVARQLQQAEAIAHDPNQPMEDRMNAMAILNAATVAYTQQLERQTQGERAFANELSTIPAEDRAEVELRARRDNIGPQWAYKDLKSERYDQSTKRDEAGRKQREAEEALRRSGGKPQTHITPVAGGAIADAGFTEDEYVELVRKASPPNNDAAARKRLDAIDRGLIRPRAG